MVAEAKEEEQNQRYRTDQNANLNTTIDSEEETDEEECISGLGEQGLDIYDERRRKTPTIFETPTSPKTNTYKTVLGGSVNVDVSDGEY